jgi:zinc transporter, ZIP family
MEIVQGYLFVLALAALPAAGNFVGGLLAEFFAVSNKMLSLALHAASGILLAVVGVELMPQVLEAEPAWVVVAAFVAGGGFALLMDKAAEWLRTWAAGSGGSTGPWVIYFSVAADLFSDGLLIGTGATISSNLGLLLALGQVPADLPEGFATIATLKKAGVARHQRILLAAAFALPVLLGATIGYWLVRDGSELLKLALLSFTAAILTSTAVEEIIGEAHEQDEDTNWHELAFIGGFALFMLLSLYFE